MVGSSADTMKISMNKSLTRNLVSQNAELEARGELLSWVVKSPTIPYPTKAMFHSEEQFSGVSWWKRGNVR